MNAMSRILAFVFRRQDLCAVIGLWGAVLAITAPFLFFGYLSAGDDQLSNFYPLSLFYHQAIQAGTSFLWNPFYYGGFPAFVDLSLGAYNPLHYLLFRIFSPFFAHHLVIAIGIAIGVVFTYWFGRLNRLSSVASVIFALLYLTSTNFDGLVIGMFSPYAFLIVPVLFVALLVSRRAARPAAKAGCVAVGSLGMAGAIISGHPQMILYGITFAGAYALFLDWQGWKTASGYRRGESTISFACMTLFAAALSLPQLVPTAAMVAQSIRTDNYSVDMSVPLPPTNLLGFFFPFFMAIPYFSGSLAGIYVGILPLAFASAAALFFRTALIRFFLGLYALMLALSVRVPVISQLHDLMPVFGRISSVGRWLTVGAFALAFFAAHGFDAVRSVPREWFARRAWKRFFTAWRAITILAIAGILLANIGLSFVASQEVIKEKILMMRLQGRTLTLPLSHYRAAFDSILANTRDRFSLMNPSVLFSVLLFPFTWWFLARLRRTSARRWCAPVAVVVVAATLGAVVRMSWKTMLAPQRVFTKTPAAIETILAREGDPRSFRILPFLMADGVYQKLGARTLSPSQGAVAAREELTGQIAGMYGVENIYGQEPMRTLREHLLIDVIIGPHRLTMVDLDAIAAGARLDQFLRPSYLRAVTVEEKVSNFERRLPLLAMMNVKYVYSAFPLAHSKLTAVPLTRDPGIGIPLYLYELRDPLPRFYFAGHPVSWEGSDRDLLLAMAKEDDFSQATYLECGSCAVVPHDQSGDRIEIIRSHAGDVELRTESRSGGYLVFGESAAPGWVAKIDGKAAPIATANYLFQAVQAPAGAHTVTFEYRNLFFLNGETLFSRLRNVWKPSL